MSWECLAAPFRCSYLIIWPIISILLGIVAGCISSICVTTIVFVLTLLRTPMHILKMMHVTVTTNECFRGKSIIMRTLVFVSVPVMHVLFLIGITLVSATVGTFYYIGKATAIIYKHEYKKAANKIKSNVRLEPKSNLGKYIKECQDYMNDDSASYGPINTLKVLWSLIPGLVLSSLVLVPFALGAVAITLYRLPINVYKTVKIALFTVVLKWDLRLVVLVTLPMIHVLFPMVIFMGALCYSLCWTWYRTSRNITQGKNPFRKWDKLKEALEEYHQAHCDFVRTHCNRFDHPSGIPDGWDGTSYSLQVQRVLRWQRDFLFCCFLILLEVPVCLLCASLISGIKYLPSCIYLTKKYCSDNCFNPGDDCASCMAIWPFHVLAVVLQPAGILILEVCFVLSTIFWVACQVTAVTFTRGFYAAWKVQFRILRDYDKFTGEFCANWEIFAHCGLTSCCCGEDDDDDENQQSETRSFAPAGQEEAKSNDAYWDRFISQSINTSSMLLEKGFITIDEVEGMEPSAIQCIPAVAILTILIDSVSDKDLPRKDLKWSIDGTICKEKGRPKGDQIADHLLPLIFAIKRTIQTHQKNILTQENIEVLTALLCSDREQEMERLKEILEGADKSNEAINNNIRTQINRLVMAILRVKPYQSRMEPIFTFRYVDAIEQGCQPSGTKTKQTKQGSSGRNQHVPAENESTLLMM